MRAGIPAGRYGKSEAIAGTVAFLLSPDACYITGQNIGVDGGITRSVWRPVAVIRLTRVDAFKARS